MPWHEVEQDNELEISHAEMVSTMRCRCFLCSSQKGLGAGGMASNGQLGTKWGWAYAKLTRKLTRSLRGNMWPFCVFCLSLWSNEARKVSTKPQLAEAWNHVSLENIQADEHLQLTKTTNSKHIVRRLRSWWYGISISEAFLISESLPLTTL